MPVKLPRALSVLFSNIGPFSDQLVGGLPGVTPLAVK